MRVWLACLCLAIGGCSFGGGGIAPFTPAPAAVDEADLEVPYVQTPRPVVAAMLDLAGVGAEDYLIDLGSGDGRIAIMAAQRGARSLGVDLDPDRIAEAVLAAQVAQVETRARFRREDLFATPLREASVVSMYLLPQVNLRLRPRLLTELRPGSRIVSHNFTMGDWAPDESREVGASHVYLWIVPAAAEGRWAVEGGGTLELEQHFQEIGGSFNGQTIRDAVLRGRHLRFTVDAGGSERTYAGVVGDAEIVPDTGTATPLRARRLD